jgi:septum site-determining protein MinC
MPNTTLKLRGRLVASHQIPVTTLQVSEFRDQLLATIHSAPALFKNAPCILDVSELSESVTEQDLSGIVETCKETGLVPYAITGNRDCQQQIAETLKMAWLDFKAKPAKPNNAEKLTTKIINTPVRSGQQIYAKDSHLIIMNQVSAGAEVAADGNIHIFGTLRGRAIAGATGNTTAQVVCQQMLAELISIAGTYVVQDDFPKGEGGAHCYLDNDSLVIDYV